MSSRSEAASGTIHSPDYALIDIEHFLDNPAVRNFMKRHERETDNNRSLLDTVNAVMSVGAFIAGVQAQLLSITYNTSSTRLSRAINWFGFVGLTLDLAGVSAGMIGALFLQRAIRHADRIAMWFTNEIDDVRRDVERLRNSLVANPSVPTSLADKMATISRVLGLMENSNFDDIIRSLLVTVELGGVVGMVGMGVWHRVLTFIARTVRPNLSFGVQSIGGSVVSLAGGILCLLASVILFARASQPHGVWVSCTAIATIILIYSIFSGIGAYLTKRGLYGRLERQLQPLDPQYPVAGRG